MTQTQQQERFPLLEHLPMEKPTEDLPVSSSPPPWPDPSPSCRQRGRKLVPLLCLLVLLVGSFVAMIQQPGTPSLARSPQIPSPVGQVTWQDSRDDNQDTTGGINDSVHLHLDHLVPPRPGKAYYAWLLSDQGSSESDTFLLGKLVLHDGSATLAATDPHHRNLLASLSQVLVTEEDATVPPLVPSPDRATWRDLGLIAQTPDPQDQQHASLLSHLRQLLATDPTLEALGLHGSLDAWQSKNGAKLLEWTQSARDAWGQADPAFVRRQLIRTLESVDGTANVYDDVPATIPLLVDPVAFRVGLIDVTKHQPLPGYFTQIAHHLSSIVTAPGVTAHQKQLALAAIAAVNSIAQRLQEARQMIITLLAFSDAQFHQERAHVLLDHLVNHVSDAYAGTREQPGSVWLHWQIEQMATIEVKAI